jgi:DNA-binding MarR family transcriptional regulator
MFARLKEEIRMSAPFAGVEEEVSLNLLRTAAVLEHAIAESLKPFGLTPTQYNVLRILRGAGERGLCRNEVGERMLTPVPDATRLLDRLEDAGLVERHRDSEDRRFVTARITGKGRALLAKLDVPVRGMHERWYAHMSGADLRTLASLLEDARARMPG